MRLMKYLTYMEISFSLSESVGLNSGCDFSRSSYFFNILVIDVLFQTFFTIFLTFIFF
jgi:hypothetical protein